MNTNLIASRTIWAAVYEYLNRFQPKLHLYFWLWEVLYWYWTWSLANNLHLEHSNTIPSFPKSKSLRFWTIICYQVDISLSQIVTWSLLGHRCAALYPVQLVARLMSQPTSYLFVIFPIFQKNFIGVTLRQSAKMLSIW